METPGTAAPALPPETLEGWYALHQIYSVDRAALKSGRNATAVALSRRVETTRAKVTSDTPTADHSQGWTAFASLIGSTADVMVVHFRQTLDQLGDAQRELERSPIMAALKPVYSFLSVTEAGLYHLTATLAAEAEQRGGAVGDDMYRAELEKRSAAERESSLVKRRLYPPLPSDMPYICFYPMTKRRDAGQNWYSLTLGERSQLMRAHGTTGRRYAGRVMQVITGAIGFDAWEWGVTLFAKDPLDFKKLVTDMRFDEVSAKYAEFGTFYVGRVATGADESLESLVETIVG